MKRISLWDNLARFAGIVSVTFSRVPAAWLVATVVMTTFVMLSPVHGSQATGGNSTNLMGITSMFLRVAEHFHTRSEKSWKCSSLAAAAEAVVSVGLVVVGVPRDRPERAAPALSSSGIPRPEARC